MRQAKKLNLTVYIERDEDGLFVGSIPTIPSCHAQGKTQERMLKNLGEVVRLCLRNKDKETVQSSHFVGIQNMEFAYA